MKANFTSTQAATTFKSIFAWVRANYNDHCDHLGDVNLTSLEEEARIAFNISDADFDAHDISFQIWQFSERIAEGK